jgi:opacity protein-like surface antigen
MRRISMTWMAAAVLAISFAVDAASAASAGAESAGPARRSLREGRGVNDATLLRMHAGFAMPSGDFGDVFDGGFGFGLNIAHGISRSVLISAGVAYHGFDGEGFDADASITPVTLNLDAILPSSGRIKPWIGGGIGFYNVDVDTGPIVIPAFGTVSGSIDETNFGINLGAGFGAPAGASGVWGLGIKYHHVFEGDIFDETEFLTLQVGYGFFL